MTIETKFNIGDEVWIMKDNRPRKFVVQGISVELVDGLYEGCRHLGLDVISYEFGSRMSPLIYSECSVFRTKQELLDSL